MINWNQGILHPFDRLLHNLKVWKWEVERFTFSILTYKHHGLLGIRKNSKSLYFEGLLTYFFIWNNYLGNVQSWMCRRKQNFQITSCLIADWNSFIRPICRKWMTGFGILNWFVRIDGIEKLFYCNLVLSINGSTVFNLKLYFLCRATFAFSSVLFLSSLIGNLHI